MAGYKAGHGHRRNWLRRWPWPHRLLALVVVVVALGLLGTGLSRHLYNQGLKPVSDNQTTRIFTVKSGASVKEIGNDLETAKLIRSAWAFQLYVHSKELNDSLQAGTYALSPSQGTAQIVTILSKGQVPTDLVTILPGRRIDQVRADLINDGFAPDEVDRALSPSLYTDIPVLSYKPAGVDSLEGLLWPESYQRQADTNPSVIIRESLTAMSQQLTPDVQAAFAAEGLTTYQGLILTSIVVQEVNKPADQAQAAQVFLSRLQKGMMLGSDVTAFYGSIQADKGQDLSYDSPYNTRLHQGLPPGPISTISQSGLSAATHPASTNWLYFVAGDDGNTYFSSTLEEHEALTDKYCHKLCGR